MCLLSIMDISFQSCLYTKNYLVVFSDLIYLNVLKENFHQYTKERKEPNISLELSRTKKEIFC